jgi:hypothetical protein
VQPRSLPGVVVRNLVAGLIPANIALRASDDALAWTPEPGPIDAERLARDN